MSEIKVNKISPRTNCGTTQLGDSGDTFTIPAGATITNNGTANGFGATGAVNWQTTVKSAGFTAVAGEGYFVNTTSGAISVNLPAGTAGAVVGFADYAGTFTSSNKVTLVQNGSDKINGSTTNGTLETAGQSVTLVFVDATKGWIVTDTGLQSDVAQTVYVAASGGNAVVTSGDFKSHIFTSPGTFTVTCAGNAAGSNKIDYLVVAGGGSAGGYYAAGGAGGFRISNGDGQPAPTMSPLATPTNLPVTATAYPVTVGAGGAANPSAPNFGAYDGNNGSNSIFAGSTTITSAGGGKGVASGPTQVGGSGGSGGNSAYYRPACGQGQGNTPPVSPPQGNPAGRSSYANGGGGGGAGAAGQDGTIGGSWNTSPSPGSPNVGGSGGIGSFIADSTIGPTAPSYGESGPVSNTRYFAGGGGAGVCQGQPGPSGSGGVGGGGDGQDNNGPFGPAQNAVVNTGGGGGASGGGVGGSGIVIIRYKFQN